MGKFFGVIILSFAGLYLGMVPSQNDAASVPESQSMQASSADLAAMSSNGVGGGSTTPISFPETTAVFSPVPSASNIGEAAVAPVPAVQSVTDTAGPINSATTLPAAVSVSESVPLSAATSATAIPTPAVSLISMDSTQSPPQQVFVAQVKQPVEATSTSSQQQSTPIPVDSSQQPASTAVDSSEQRAAPIATAASEQQSAPIPTAASEQRPGPIPTAASEQQSAPIPTAASEQRPGPIPTAASEQQPAPIPTAASEQQPAPIPTAASEQQPAPIPTAASEQQPAPIPTAASGQQPSSTSADSSQKSIGEALGTAVIQKNSPPVAPTTGTAAALPSGTVTAVSTSPTDSTADNASQTPVAPTTSGPIAVGKEQKLLDLLKRSVVSELKLWTMTQGRVIIEKVIRVKFRANSGVNFQAVEDALWMAYKQELESIANDSAYIYLDRARSEMERKQLSSSVSGETISRIQEQLDQNKDDIVEKQLKVAQGFYTKLFVFIGQMGEAVKAACGDDVQCAAQMVSYPRRFLRMWFPQVPKRKFRSFIRQEKQVNRIERTINRVIAKQQEISDMQVTIPSLASLPNSSDLGFVKSIKRTISMLREKIREKRECIAKSGRKLFQQREELIRTQNGLPRKRGSPPKRRGQISRPIVDDGFAPKQRPASINSTPAQDRVQQDSSLRSQTMSAAQIVFAAQSKTTSVQTTTVKSDTESTNTSVKSRITPVSPTISETSTKDSETGNRNTSLNTQIKVSESAKQQASTVAQQSKPATSAANQTTARIQTTTLNSAASESAQIVLPSQTKPAVQIPSPAQNKPVSTTAQDSLIQKAVNIGLTADNKGQTVKQSDTATQSAPSPVIKQPATVTAIQSATASAVKQPGTNTSTTADISSSERPVVNNMSTVAATSAVKQPATNPSTTFGSPAAKQSGINTMSSIKTVTSSNSSSQKDSKSFATVGISAPSLLAKIISRLTAEKDQLIAQKSKPTLLTPA